MHTINAPQEGVLAHQREVHALVELRVPFTLSRDAIDDVERGSSDSDWQPVKDAARKIAFAEDGLIFEGYQAAGIQGLRAGSSNPAIALPADVRGYPEAIATALSASCAAKASTARTRSRSAPTRTPRSARPATTATR